MAFGDVVFQYNQDEVRFYLGVAEKLKAELFYNVFYKLFDVVHADTQALKDEAHRIRYQVFCLENEGYEDPAEHPDGLEKDKYDHNSNHALLIFKPTGHAIGTVRIIGHNPDNWRQSFPLQEVSDSEYLQSEHFVKSACELSRLCISTELRRDVVRHIHNLKNVFSFNSKEQFNIYEKPLINIAMKAASLGLIRGAYEMVMNNNCLNIVTVTESKHLQRYQHAGLLYNVIGSEIDYHGKRVPIHTNILDVKEHGIVNNHDIWRIVTNKGENHRRALDIFEEIKG
jgi:N-acyl amino acid synthase of PEP-CTERM/exosortase system